MKRLPMRKMRDVLRLSAEGLSTHQIAVNLAMGRSTLQSCLDVAQAAGVKGPIPRRFPTPTLGGRSILGRYGLCRHGREIRTGSTSAVSCGARVSPCSCFGKCIARIIQTNMGLPYSFLTLDLHPALPPAHAVHP